MSDHDDSMTQNIGDLSAQSDMPRAMLVKDVDMRPSSILLMRCVKHSYDISPCQQEEGLRPCASRSPALRQTDQ